MPARLAAALGVVFGLNVLQAPAQTSPRVIWQKETHNYFINPVAISPNGLLVASAGSNHTIRLAHLSDGNLLSSLIGHTGALGCVAFSPDGSLLASTGEDRILRIWHGARGVSLRSIEQGAGNRQFTAVAFHPDGQHVAGDRNRTNVVLWRISDGTPVWEASGRRGQVESIAFSPDASVMAVSGGSRGEERMIRIYHAGDGRLLHSLLTSNTYGIRQLAFSPDGRWLAAGCYEGENFPGGVELWRVSDWTQHRRLRVFAPTQAIAPALAFAPSGRVLLTQRIDGIDFWSIPEGRLLHSIGRIGTNHYGKHYSIAVSPRGDRIVSGIYQHIFTNNGTQTQGGAAAIRFPVMVGIGLQPGRSAVFDWIGNSGAVQLQRLLLGETNWTNLGEASTNSSVTLPLDGNGAFFRLIEVGE